MKNFEQWILEHNPKKGTFTKLIKLDSGSLLRQCDGESIETVLLNNEITDQFFKIIKKDKIK